MSTEEVMLPNAASVASVSGSGFILNLYKSVPSLSPEDLELSYWNGTETVYPVVTSVTALDSNASFNVAVDLTSTSDAYLSGGGINWKLGEEGWEPGQLMEQLWITIPSETFEGWVVDSDLPIDRRGRLDRNGPLMMQNLMAYAMGLNPMTVTADDLAVANEPDPEVGMIHLIYRRAKNLSDVELTPMISINLETWSAASVVSESILEEDVDWEKVDALVEFTPESAAFFKFVAETVP
jgi:hypothetical protein